MRFIRILPVFFVRFELWIFTRFFWIFYKDSSRILECILVHLLLPVFERDLSEFFWNHCSKEADNLWILLDSLNNFMGILQFFPEYTVVHLLLLIGKVPFSQDWWEFFFEERNSSGIRKSLLKNFPKKKHTFDMKS